MMMILPYLLLHFFVGVRVMGCYAESGRYIPCSKCYQRNSCSMSTYGGREDKVEDLRWVNDAH